MMSVAVLGAGPSGLSATKALLKRGLLVYLYEKEAFPGGLLLKAASPYNWKVKNMVDHMCGQIDAVLESRSGDLVYRNNMHLTREDILDLKGKHQALILALGGNNLTKPMNIPGENLPGVISAHDVIGFYNGTLEFSKEQSVATTMRRTESKDIVLIGMGDVALDIAEIIGSQQHPQFSFIRYGNPAAANVIHHLRNNKILILGRKPLSQASWSLARFREFRKHVDRNFWTNEIFFGPLRDKSRFQTFYEGTFTGSKTTSDLIIRTRACVQYIEKEVNGLKIQTDKEALENVGLIIVCTGYAHTNPLKGVLDESDPMIRHVGWFASNGMGNATKSILSGKNGAADVLVDISAPRTSVAINDPGWAIMRQRMKNEKARKCFEMTHAALGL